MKMKGNVIKVINTLRKNQNKITKIKEDETEGILSLYHQQTGHG